MPQQYEKLKKNFYIKHPIIVARNLLGKLFVRNLDGEFLVGRIVETEAYDGAVDEAAHTFIGKTQRNAVMFEDGGLLYVYFTYGMHYCANVVCGPKDHGQAVLLRGIEPLEGIPIMSRNRFGKLNLSAKEFRNLTNGPAKICEAFGITRKEYGADLNGDEIFILNQKKIPDSSVIVTTRIGIKKSVDLPWRFYIKDNPFVSKL